MSRIAVAILPGYRARGSKAMATLVSRAGAKWVSSTLGQKSIPPSRNWRSDNQPVRLRVQSQHRQYSECRRTGDVVNHDARGNGQSEGQSKLLTVDADYLTHDEG